MKTNNLGREYLSHVTLMFLGDDLKPSEITRSLGLRPRQSWMPGEPSASGSKSVHSHGGWKKSLPKAQLLRPLPSQLRFWVRALSGRTRAIAAIASQGHLCTLNAYIASSATASIIIPADLQRAIGALGLELRLSFFAHERDA